MEEGIDHRIVSVNSIKMHIAEKGLGPVVLFLHGFPELWYSWRHQIHALSSLGYHAVAPDLWGFDDTEGPTSITSYTCDHIFNELVALIDSLGVEQVFLVAHDCVPFTPRSPQMMPMDRMRGFFGDDYYICRFQAPGAIEAEIAELETGRPVTEKWTGVQVKVPVEFIVGDLDMVYTTVGTKEYIHNGGFKKDVPFLEEAVVMEGVGHFINQEKAEEIGSHIYDFIKKFK
uniref:AB hydrolase-1 domain-containing protein n=1 Tax=Quercus lobata TaxID=97700 RepID=A0A7N2L688_QUELO